MTRCSACWLEFFDYLLPDFKGSFYSWVLSIVIFIVFIIYCLVMITTMLNSPVLPQGSLRQPYSYVSFNDLNNSPDPVDSTNGIFTFFQVSDLHISSRQLEHSDELELVMEKAYSIFNPGFVVFSGDLVDAFNKGYSQGEEDWIEYERILTEFGLEDPDKLIDIKGNHDVYGIASQVSPSNFFCQYSTIARNPDPDNFLYNVCQRWKNARKNNSELTITYDDEYKSHLYIKDLKITDNVGSPDDGILGPPKTHVYRFMGLDFSPVPSTPFPMNFLVQIPTEFTTYIVQTKYNRDGSFLSKTMDGYDLSTVVVSHYCSSQVSVSIEKSDMGKPALVGVYSQIGVDAVITGHEHRAALAFNSDPFAELELTFAYCQNFNSRLFVYDNYGESLAAINIPKEVKNKPLPVILFPPHSAFPIGVEMARLVDKRSKIRVLVYLDTFQYDPSSQESINAFKNVVNSVNVRAYVYYPGKTPLVDVPLTPVMEASDPTLPKLLEAPLIGDLEDGVPPTKRAALNNETTKLHAILYTGDWTPILNKMVDRSAHPEGHIKIVARYNKPPAVALPSISTSVLQPFSFYGNTSHSSWFKAISPNTYNLRGASKEIPLGGKKNKTKGNHSSIGGAFNSRLYGGDDEDDDEIFLSIKERYETTPTSDADIENIDILPIYSSKPGMDVLNWVDPIMGRGTVHRATYYSLTLVFFSLTMFISVSRLISFFILDKKSVSFRFVGRKASHPRQLTTQRHSGTIGSENIVDAPPRENDVGSFGTVNFVIPVRRRSFSVVPIIRNPYQFILSCLSVLMLVAGVVMVMTSRVHGNHEESADIFMHYFGTTDIEVQTPEITTANGIDSKMVVQTDGNMFMFVIIMGGLSICITDGSSLVLTLLSYFRLRTDWENIPMSIKKKFARKGKGDQTNRERVVDISVQNMDDNHNGYLNNIESPPCVKQMFGSAADNTTAGQSKLRNVQVAGNNENENGGESDNSLIRRNFIVSRKDSSDSSSGTIHSVAQLPFFSFGGQASDSGEDCVVDVVSPANHRIPQVTLKKPETEDEKEKENEEGNKQDKESSETQSDVIEGGITARIMIGNESLRHSVKFAPLKRGASSYIGRSDVTVVDPGDAATESLAEEIIGLPLDSYGNNSKYKPDVTAFTRHCGLCVDMYCCCACCDCTKTKHCSKLGDVFNYEFWTIAYGLIQFNLVSFTTSLYISIKVWTGLKVDLDIWYLVLSILVVVFMVLSIVLYFLLYDNGKCINKKPITILVTCLILSVVCQILTQYLASIFVIVPGLDAQNDFAAGIVTCAIKQLGIYFTFTLVDLIILVVLRIVIVKLKINYVVKIPYKRELEAAE